MHRDPSREPYPDGTDFRQVSRLLCARPKCRRFEIDPKPNLPIDEPAIEAEVSEDAAHRLSQIGNVASHVAAIGLEIEDGVANELPWCVQGDVTAAFDFDEVYAQRLECLSRSKQVARFGAAPERNDGLMFDEQNGIRNLSVLPGGKEAALKRQNGLVFALSQETAKKTSFCQ